MHSKEVSQFLKQWGSWAAEKGKPTYQLFPIFNLTFIVLGVGSLRPNEKDSEEEEEEEESAETKDEAWRGLLDGEGLLTLKPWKEVAELKANKVNLGLALREYMRQAWGGVFLFFHYLSYLTLICSENSGRRGKITWGVLNKKTQSLIPPRFLLNVKLDNPTRMPLAAISVYWNDWVFKAKKGDHFSFLGADERQGEASSRGDSQRDSDTESTSTFTIDNGVLPPFQCGITPSEHTKCLQGLVTGRSDTSKTFRQTVNLVDTLEVSYIRNMIYTCLIKF